MYPAGPYPQGTSPSAEAPGPARAPLHALSWAGTQRPALPQLSGLGLLPQGRSSPGGLVLPAGRAPAAQAFSCTPQVFVSLSVRHLLFWQCFYLNTGHRQKMREESTAVCVRLSERHPCSDAGINTRNTPKPRSGPDIREYQSSPACCWAEIHASALPQPGALPGKHCVFPTAVQPPAAGTQPGEANTCGYFQTLPPESTALHSETINQNRRSLFLNYRLQPPTGPCALITLVK